MTTTALLAYALALILAIATPGPAMLAVIGRGLAQGSRPALLMAGGVAVADVILGSLALLGLAALMAAFSWLFAVVKYAGAAYLVWLGIRMLRAPLVLDKETHPVSKRDFLVGMAIALSNPKAILFHASLMPLIVDLRLLDQASALAILTIIFFANLAVMSAYALLAGRGSAWFRTPKRLRWLNLAGGGSMVGAGAIVAAR
jgi:threonine/homoserine/homoserine lactone efflux protein